MKSIIVIVSMMLCGCATMGDKLTVSYDLPTAQTTWIERNPPTAPLNEAEILAVQSAAKHMTLTQPGASATYESTDESFTRVRHEETTSGDESFLVTVTYKIRDGLVYGETIPSAKAILDPEKEAIAQEVAFNAVKGASAEIPVVYQGRFFIAKKDPIYGFRCNVDVIEKDLEKEYTVYHIKTC